MKLKLNEDWWATIIGLAIALGIFIGLLPKLPWPLIGFLK
jgi:hypothetical protein